MKVRFRATRTSIDKCTEEAEYTEEHFAGKMGVMLEIKAVTNNVVLISASAARRCSLVRALGVHNSKANQYDWKI